MEGWLIVLSAIYLAFLIGYAILCWIRKIPKSPAEFLYSSGKVGLLLSFLGISATLFSTFTLQGMPSFFKSHGIGAWIFLGVTDVCLAGLMLFFGLRLRGLAKKFTVLGDRSNATSLSPMNITELIKRAGLGRVVMLFYAVFTTLFLIPYVTIQVKGASLLFHSAIPIGETHLFWSFIIVLLMLTYSTFGGIRAIFVTDAVQGIILLIAAWAVALFSINRAGGISNIFSEAATLSPALMSTPGPAGVLTWQFLLVSFISITLMPYVQPQLATRVLVAKDDKTFVRASLGLGIFALLAILPTVFIGLRGVVITGINSDFLVNLLNSDVPPFFHALFILGVIAAAMSTSDSQLLAVGTEWGSSVTSGSIEENRQANLLVKISGALVALVAIFLAQTSFKSLVLFSVNSFIGTSFLLPIVIATSITSKFFRRALVLSSMISVVVFLLALFQVIPKEILGLRIELLLYLVLGVLIAFSKIYETG